MSTKGNTIIIDLDGTLCDIKKEGERYADVAPKLRIVEKLKEYKVAGFGIVIFTARNMRTFGGNMDKLREVTLPIIEKWLATHEVPYDEIVIGKPWPGENGFYIDDRTVRPNEFLNLTREEIIGLLDQR